MEGSSSSGGDLKKVDGGLELQVSAPGKVILHGEHAVIYGNTAVAAALGLRTRMKIIEIEDPDVIVLDLRPFRCVKTFKISDLQDLWLDPSIVTSDTSNFNLSTVPLVNFESLLTKIHERLKILLSEDEMEKKSIILAFKCILFLLAAFKCSINAKMTSLCVKVKSELQIGAGTGSSASFSVCGAAAFLQYFKLKTVKLTNISKEEYKPFSWEQTELDSLDNLNQRQLDLICQWSFLGERIFHGTPSGIDNTVCTYGNMVQFRKGETPTHIELKTTFGLLLINTNVSRNTAELVAKVADFRDQFPVLVDKILDCIENVTVDAIQLIMKMETYQHIPGQPYSKQYIKDFKNLAWLSYMNHIFLMSLGASHPKLEEIMRILSKKSLNGKLTGAGGGGCAIALIPPTFDSTNVIEELENSGFGVYRTQLGGQGVTVD